MRRPYRLIALLLAGIVAGCGGKFDLPTQSRTIPVPPTDKSYKMLQTWTHMDSIQDILITQGAGSQLFMLFNYGGTGGPNTARGEVKLFPFAQPTPIGAPYFHALTTLFNPIAIAAASGRLLVLDLGDTCMAKYDAVRGRCDADPTPSRALPFPQPRPDIVRDYAATWRVREYPLSGGDTISTFTDTTFAVVYGVAADNQGSVYVSGLAAVLDTSVTSQQDRTRRLASRVYRYVRGPRYAGINPPDVNMPGANWHRDTTWVVKDGTGSIFVLDPRGIAVSNSGSPALLVADYGNNLGKTILLQPNADNTLNPGVFFDARDAQDAVPRFEGPTDVAADLQGFLYVVDRGNQRITRHAPDGSWIQNINVEVNSFGETLKDPVTVGVDDSMAYVGDRGRSQVIRYKRRP